MDNTKLIYTDTPLPNLVINKLDINDFNQLTTQEENGINPNELYLVVNDINDADTIGGKELKDYDLSIFQNEGEDRFAKKSDIPEIPETAKNAEKLGDNLPEYYASKKDVDDKIGESVETGGVVATAINTALEGYSNAVVVSSDEKDKIDGTTLLYIDFEDNEKVPTYITSEYKINNKYLGDESLVLTGEDINISSEAEALTITAKITEVETKVDNLEDSVGRTFATQGNSISSLEASIGELDDKIGAASKDGAEASGMYAAIEVNAAAISGINEKNW